MDSSFVDSQPATLFDQVDRLAAEEASDTKLTQAMEQHNSVPPAPDPAPSVPSVEVIQPEQPSFIEPKADLIYGATGSGKTVNIGEVSNYVLSKYGKLTRMVSADGGGFGPLGGLVKSGQIEYWAISAWKYPIAALSKAVKGYWPLRLDDPESPLVPPDAGTWEVYGFGAFEGLTSFGDMILANLKDEKASLSQDPSYSWKQDGVEFSGGNMAYYGFMQDNLQRDVAISHLLGYNKVLWTAQESRGDDQGGAKVYGPMIGGKKATGKAGGWFLNVFHMDIINGDKTKDSKTGQELIDAKHILFLKTHIDPLTMTPFPCKVRAPKAYAKDIPAYLDSGSISEAYRLLDLMYEKQEKESGKAISEISGLREKLLENAAKARLAEAAAAEKRAKASNLLKPMVTVPALTTPLVPASSPMAGVVSKVAGPVSSGGPVSPAPASPASRPLGVPTIQNVRKKV